MNALLKKKKSNFFDVAIAFGLKIIGTGVSTITSIMIGRNFSAVGTGVYSLSSSILSVIMIFCVFGFDISLVKYIAIENQRETHGNLKKLVKNTIAVSMAITIGFVLVVELGANLIAFIFSKPNLSTMLRIMIIAIIPMTLLKLSVSVLKGIGHIKMGLSFESVIMHIFMCIGLVILLLFGATDHIYMVGVVYLVSASLSFLIIFAINKHYFGKLNDVETEDYSFSSVIKTARTLLLVNSTNYILTSMDSIMLGIMTSSEQVGIYTVATKITLLSSMLLSAINAILGPKFAVLCKEGKTNELSKIVKKFSRAMIVVAIFICIVMSFGSKWILMLWGNEFTEGIAVLRICLVGQFVVLATGPLATLLMMAGYEKIHRNNTIVCSVINLCLNMILIPIWGIEGAAIATSVGLIVKNLYCVYAVKKKFGFWCY